MLLMQATMEIKQLKRGLHEQETHCRELSRQLSTLTAKVEDLHDENTVLRKKVQPPIAACVVCCILS
jgi:uncharacterized coiled-coil protein SlyX